MNKVYLLLRNNQQTGPYSLEELIHLPLKPVDLIWVEGKSFGWSYPREIDTLKPYVASATGAPEEPSSQAASPSIPEPIPASRKIFVSLPQNAAERAAAQPQQPQQLQPQLQTQASTADMLEQKAEELRKRIQAQAAESSAQPIKETQTRYSRSINDVEEEYTNWAFRQKAKKRKTPGVQWAAALLVLGLAGYWGWSRIADDQGTAQPQALVQSTPNQQAGEPEQTSPEDNALVPVANSPVPVAEKKKATGESTLVQQQEKRKASSLPQVQEDEPSIASSAVQETPSPAPPVIETPMDNGAKEGSTVTAEPKKERKKLGKAINNVLEKLKGKDETAEEAPRSVTGSSGERRAVRRGQDNNSVVSEAPNLAAQIKLVASERPENWMMGVVGQKLTLYNSNQTIKSATVEVLYYNEQDKLLEKKQIHFTNIGPSRTKTVAIPDHRFADHASYKVITASGDEESYARLR